jgi:Effector-associated domain 11
MDEQTKDQIRDFISKSRLDKALTALSAWAELHGDKDLRNMLFLKSGEFSALRGDENMGFLTSSEANMRRNKLASTILSLIDDAEESAPQEAPKTTIIAPSTMVNTPQMPPSNIASALKTILFMGANPPDTSKVQIEIEHSRISSELDNKFNLKVAKFVSATEIPKLITANKPYIIHFSGHGKDPESGEHGATSGDSRLIALPSDYSKRGGIVVFDNDMRKMKILEDNQLEYLFKTVVNGFKIPIEVALFNSCYSESQAKVLGKYIPYVIGSSLAIKDDIAIAFAVGFYYGIANGNTIEEAFLQGKMQAVFEEASAETLIVLYKNGELQAI